MGEKTLSISEGRKCLLTLADKANATFDRFILTRNGEPAIVILSYEDYEGLLETLDINQTLGLTKEIKKRAAQMRAGKRLTHDEVWPK